MLVRLRLVVLAVASLAVSLLACGPRETSLSPDPRPDAVVGQGTVLSRVDLVSAGVDCAAGGKAVKSGIDANRDLVLQDSEVTATQLVCFEPTQTLLVRTDAEPAGTHCAISGQAVRAGLDSNGNGVLDDAEVDRVSYVCGATPPTPTALLTRQVPVAAGATCTNGGTRLDAGRDANGDGALQDSEVERTAMVCNPAPEPRAPLLERDQPAPPGACPGSGWQVLAGFDSNGDGALSALEVVATITECSDTYPTFTVATAADLALVQRATRIAGDLVIRSPELESVSIPAEVIDGSIVIEANPKLEHVSLAVRLLGGGIHLQNDALLTTVLFEGASAGPSLKRIGGNLELIDVPSLSYVGGLTGLETIGGNLTLRRSGLRSMPPMDRLSFVGGHLFIEQNPVLSGWWTTPTQSLVVQGMVRLTANPSWERGSLGYLRSAWGGLWVTDDGLGKASFLSAELWNAGGLVLTGNRTLHEIDLPVLTSILGDFVVADNAVLDLPEGANDFLTVSAEIRIERNASLTSLGALMDLTLAGGAVMIADNPKLELIWTKQLTEAADVRILRNAALTVIGKAPGKVGLAGLASVKTLDIEGNPALTELSLPLLTSADALTVKDNAALSTCSALALARQLTAPAVPAVTITGNAGDVASCP